MKLQDEIALVDKMTPTLNKIQKKALENVAAINKLQKAHDDLVNQMAKSSKIEGFVGSDLDMQSSKALEEIKNQISTLATENVVDSVNKVNPALDQSKLKLTEINQGLELTKKAMSVLVGLVDEANKLMEISKNQFNEEYLTAVRLHNVLGATPEEIQSMYDYASAIADVGIVSDQAVLAGVQELATFTQSQETLKDFIPIVVDLAVAENGLNTTQQNVAQTASLVGKALNGDATYLKKVAGLTTDQVKALKKMNTQEERANALYKILKGRVNGANEALSNTAYGGLARVNNKFIDLQETIGQKVTPYLYTMQNFLLNLFTPALDFVAEHMDVIAPIVLGLVGVLAVLTGALTILAIKNFLVGASWIAAAWPILLVVGAILLAVYAIHLMVKANNAWQDSTFTTMGVVMGVVFLLAAFIYNVLIVPLWNGFARLFNFIENAVVHPAESMKIAFLDSCLTITNALQKVANVIDTLFNTNFANGIQNISNELTRLKRNLENSIDYEEVLPKLDEWDYKDAINQGMALGDGISKGLESGSAMSGLLDTITSVLGTDITGAPAFTMTTNDNLLSDEDIKFLLDLATRDYKLDYQQITPEITMQFGDIRETADVDEIIDVFAERLEEIYVSDLEVV